MFSRFYNSAKALFTDPAINENDQPGPTAKPQRDETMVTTRQRNTQVLLGDEIEEEDSINVYVPSSNSKNQRNITKETPSSGEDAAEYVPPSSRKRKRLPVRAKDVESPDPGKARPVVEIPIKKISPEPDHGNILADGGEDENIKAQDEEHDTVAVEHPKGSNHHRFGSESANEEYFSTAREVMHDKDETNAVEDSRVVEDSEDSDDDAPEAVGVQEAAESIKIKARESARVVKEQVYLWLIRPCHNY
jgi:U3 small nucleolar RNA-associated protein 16